MRAQLERPSVYRPRLRVPQSALAILWVLGVLLALLLIVGMRASGIAFLAALAPHALALIFALVGFGVVLAAGSAYIVLKGSSYDGSHSAGSRYFAPLRMAAVAVLVPYVAAAGMLVANVLRFDLGGAAPVRPGQFGVAIAEFEAAGRPSASAGEFSTFLARSLRRQLQSSPGLRGRVTVIAAPVLRSDREARDFAARNGVQLVVWGRATESVGAFIPSVAVLEPASYQLRYGNVPAPHEAPLTAGGSVELAATTPSQDSGLVEYLMGLVYLGRGSYEGAITELDRAVQQASGAEGQPALADSLAAYQLALARAYARLGDAPAARAAYESALAQKPDDPTAYVGLGNLSYEQGECQAALDGYGRAVQLAPALALSRYSRGNALFCLGRYQDAASDYREAIRLSPSSDAAVNLYYLILGATLCQAGQTKEGMAQLSLARAGNLVRSADSETQSCLKLAEAMVATAGPAPAVTPAPQTTRPQHSPGPEPTWTAPVAMAWPSRLPTRAPAPAILSPDTGMIFPPPSVRLPPLFLRPAATRTPPAPLGPTATAPVAPAPGALATPTYPPAPPLSTPAWTATATWVPTPAPEWTATWTAEPGPPTWTAGPPTPAGTPKATVEPTWTPLPTTPAPSATAAPTAIPPTWTPLPPTTAPTLTSAPPPAAPPTWTPLPPTDAPPPTAEPTSTSDPGPSPQPTPTPGEDKPKPTRHPTKTPKP